MTTGGKPVRNGLAVSLQRTCHPRTAIVKIVCPATMMPNISKLAAPNMTGSGESGSRDTPLQSKVTSVANIKKTLQRFRSACQCHCRLRIMELERNLEDLGAKTKSLESMLERYKSAQSIKQTCEMPRRQPTSKTGDAAIVAETADDSFCPNIVVDLTEESDCESPAPTSPTALLPTPTSSLKRNVSMPNRSSETWQVIGSGNDNEFAETLRQSPYLSVHLNNGAKKRDLATVNNQTSSPVPTPVLFVKQEDKGVVVSWNIEGLQHTIRSYELYAQECSREWQLVGSIDPLPLPMACTLTQFQNHSQYRFRVRAVDELGRNSHFSNECLLVL